MFLIDIYGLFFLFGLVKLISGYQNLKSTCPKGYQGFWNFASPELKIQKSNLWFRFKSAVITHSLMNTRADVNIFSVNNDLDFKPRCHMASKDLENGEQFNICMML